MVLPTEARFAIACPIAQTQTSVILSEAKDLSSIVKSLSFSWELHPPVGVDVESLTDVREGAPSFARSLHKGWALTIERPASLLFAVVILKREGRPPERSKGSQPL